MTTNTGGPAFPTEVWDSEGVPQHTEGMTLRDYFAIKVMQALVSRENLKGTEDDYCAMAYKSADAMLKARDQ